jgi:hypothetical protein
MLGPRDGTVTVDLIEPNAEPVKFPGKELDRCAFSDIIPNVLFRIFSTTF